MKKRHFETRRAAPRNYDRRAGVTFVFDLLAAALALLKLDLEKLCTVRLRTMAAAPQRYPFARASMEYPHGERSLWRAVRDFSSIKLAKVHHALKKYDGQFRKAFDELTKHAPALTASCGKRIMVGSFVTVYSPDHGPESRGFVQRLNASDRTAHVSVLQPSANPINRNIHVSLIAVVPLRAVGGMVVLPSDLFDLVGFDPSSADWMVILQCLMAKTMDKNDARDTRFDATDGQALAATFRSYFVSTLSHIVRRSDGTRRLHGLPKRFPKWSAAEHIVFCLKYATNPDAAAIAHLFSESSKTPEQV